MNERIRELVKQAGGISHDDDGNELAPALVGKSLEKFAELIVLEMCQVIDADCQLQMRQRVITNLGGLNQARELIKQHFGVE